jgi:DNA polymerase I-like protein with 3'-5' exonuclease and polymerase domains
VLLLPTHDTSWSPPHELPRLGDAKVIALDTETYDPRLMDRGPGWPMRDGRLVGVSVATEEQAWYIPIWNALGQPCPYGVDNVINWLKDTLDSPGIPKVGANLTYDIGWLSTVGVGVTGRLFDVQHAESLLTESGRVNLDALGMKYAGGGKTSNDLYRWCSLAYGGAPDHKQRANIYRAPMELVGPYAESDAALPLEVLRKQWPLLQEQGLLDVYDMECRLIRLLVAMRAQGVRVDVERAHRLYDQFTQEAQLILHDLAKQAGREISVNSNVDLGFLADKLGITYNRTPTGKPQFLAGWLEDHPHPTMQQVLEARQLLKLTGTFLDSYIIKGHHNGVLHGEFHQLKADGGGAKTGRFSSSHPNLQNIPVRSERGKLLRSLFLPFVGDTHWMKWDYSQIEYRMLAHYAVGMGAADVRAAYLADPRTDYHKMVQNMVLAMTGLEIPRGPIKNINFGLLYGMGMQKLSRQLGVEFVQAREMFQAYHKGAPYVDATMKATIAEAQDCGFVTTIMGRRTHFPTWVPKAGGDYAPLPFQQAVRLYGSQIERAFLYKALNYRLQGSAADLMKRAMVNCFEAGVFDRFRLPVLTVHDELDFSYKAHETDPAVFRELRDQMEHALEIAVPVIVDVEAGPNWGEVEEVAV